MNKIIHGFASLGLALAVAACGDDGGSGPDANNQHPDANVPDAGPPAPPALGTQMDRIGRPAINTALNNTFNPDNTSKQAAKDAYNTAAPADWGSFAPTLAGGLGIIDGIDTVCGNQLAYNAGGPNTYYAALAGVLADDEIYVNSASGTCSIYLGVEANALGIAPNNDCGGRVMSYDVIETSFSVLVAGTLGGIDDGIADEAVPADPDTFPFLAAPL
jgi:hypothetical protein